jgi:hypothetical protein
MQNSEERMFSLGLGFIIGEGLDFVNPGFVVGNALS